MAKEDKLRELLKLKTDIIDGNTNLFFDDLNQIKLDLYPDIRDFIGNFSVDENGKILNNRRNQLLVIKEFKIYLTKILKDKYNVSLDNYIKSLDQIDIENYKIQQLNNITISPNNFLRKFTIDNVVNQLSLDRAVNEGLKPNLQKQLFNYVVGKQSRADAEKRIKTVIQNDQGLERWSKTIANDALSQYDGQIQKELVSTFDFEGYHYVGSLIETSRPQCRHWVADLGGFIDMKDLPNEVADWKDARGYDANLELTVNSFSVVRGGYNCRHSATPGFRFKG